MLILYFEKATSGDIVHEMVGLGHSHTK